MPRAVSVTAKNKSPTGGGSCSMSAGADQEGGAGGFLGQSSLMLETLPAENGSLSATPTATGCLLGAPRRPPPFARPGL